MRVHGSAAASPVAKQQQEACRVCRSCCASLQLHLHRWVEVGTQESLALRVPLVLAESEPTLLLEW